MAEKTAAKPDTKPAAKPAEGDFPLPDVGALSRNLLELGKKTGKLVSDYVGRKEPKKGVGVVDPLNVGNAFIDLASKLLHDPRKIIEAQTRLFQSHLTLWKNVGRRLMGEDYETVVPAPKGDKRFKDAAWSENTVFDFIKQSYLLTANWLQETVEGVDGLDDKERKKIAFYTKQFVDALSPTNFVLTNPEVLKETLRTNGENLVRGVTHIIQDLERGKGRLAIRQVDETKFKVGENLATTPGKVVYQNDLMQLLQYSPTTDEVYERPLLIIPPWINKFYILDMRPDNSFIRWAVAQGYTLFVVSWVNPDQRLSQKAFDDYLTEGFYEAVDAVCKAADTNELNVIGYCIGGTVTAAGLAHMAARKDTRVKSVTFFTSQVDFTEAGDLSVFVDDEQLASMEAQMKAQGGYLDGGAMATTFNMLRSNDLIWSFVVNNYLMGRDPMAFDLLYWNSDTTRMPVAMHLQYLRDCYRDNLLSQGKMTLANVKIDLTRVKIPVFLQSSKEDHIAPAKSVYKATQLFKGDVTFMMAGSGHIAGVVNPPAANKYQYWSRETLAPTLEDWRAGATETPGSWWPYWDKWLAPKSGRKVKARIPGKGALKAIEDAPGSYVKMK
ncbi:MAG: class I poly(R)-hydroxyalkanoic acid synthase [Micropepsaceae bacterium]